MKWNFILPFVLSLNVCLAGPRVGNGGGAWGCWDEENDSYRWIQVVDLFEAENEFKLELNDFAGLHYLEVIKKLGEKVESLMIDEMNSIGTYLDSVVDRGDLISAMLVEIEDVFNRIRPSKEQCLSGEIKYLQAAIYTYDDRILIQEYIWELFSERDKAALIIHEAVYLFFRKVFGDENSVRARRIVGLLFSNLSNEKIHSEIVNQLERGPFGVTLPL